MDGRTIRSGDKVVLVKTDNPNGMPYIGTCFVVTEQALDYKGFLRTDELYPDGKIIVVNPDNVRVLGRHDHRPAGQSFEQMMASLRSQPAVA